MTSSEEPTAEERAQAKEIMKRLGGIMDLASEKITDDEAHILAMVVQGAPRGPAAEMVAIIRGHIEGDVKIYVDEEEP